MRSVHSSIVSFSGILVNKLETSKLAMMNLSLPVKDVISETNEKESLTVKSLLVYGCKIGTKNLASL